MSNHRLRELNSEDLETIFIWRNSERIRTCMLSEELLVWEQHRRWFERIKNDDRNAYLIYEYDQVPSGLVYFNDINRAHGLGTWGFYLGREDLPKGTGTRMCLLGLEYAFEVLGIRKVNAEVLENNMPSLKLHRKIGFKQEGLFVNHINKNGILHNLYRFGYFSGDWIIGKPQLYQLAFAKD